MKFHFGSTVAISAALAFCTCTLSAGAQQESPFPGLPVKILVTVEPRHSKEVPEVRAEDVIVTQGRQQDRVDSWQPVEGSSTGAQLFVLIDDSLSTQDLGSKLSDIRSFINSQPANREIGVAYMRNGTALIAQNLTKDYSAAAKALRLPIGELGASGSPYFSLQDLIKRWPQTGAAREVIMISDGIDPFWENADLNDPYVNSAIEDAQRAGIVVNAIYARASGHFGHTFWRITWGQNFLSELADATGGEAYFIGDSGPVTFTPYFNEISERIKHQYWLAFEAQPGKKSGLQRIKVSTEVHNADLVAPAQVYVPVS
jgi:hypothetical protein